MQRDVYFIRGFEYYCTTVPPYHLLDSGFKYPTRGLAGRKKKRFAFVLLLLFLLVSVVSFMYRLGDQVIFFQASRIDCFYADG